MRCCAILLYIRRVKGGHAWKKVKRRHACQKINKRQVWLDINSDETGPIPMTCMAGNSDEIGSQVPASTWDHKKMLFSKHKKSHIVIKI